MKKIAVSAAAIVLAVCLASPVRPSTTFIASLRVSNDDASVLRRSNYDYFKPRDADFDLLRNAKDGPEHTGVYLWLAREARADLGAVIQWRREGLSWAVVFGKLNVEPGRVIVALPSDPGPPYGKAYGYWKHGPGARGKHGGGGKAVVLTDMEFCDWINAKTLSVVFGLSVQDVLDRRARGESLGAIAGKAHREKEAKGKKDNAAKEGKPEGSEHGKDKGGSGKGGGNDGKGKGKN